MPRPRVALLTGDDFLLPSKLLVFDPVYFSGAEVTHAPLAVFFVVGEVPFKPDDLRISSKAMM